MSNNLPIEIVEQLLSRLPIKSLLRCSSICKTWYNLITSTKFISRHLDFTKSLPNSTRLFLDNHCTETRRRTGVLYSDDKSGVFEEYTRVEFPEEILKSQGSLHVSGSCNGLICLANMGLHVPYHFHRQKVVLWNPFIRKFLDLPISELQFSSRAQVHHHVFGFVFDHIGNDYKVLRIRSSDEIIVEVLRLSTGLWEDISYKLPLVSISQFSHQVDLNGVAHWIGKESNSELKIITFDVHEEVFGSIKLPFDVVNDHNEMNREHWLKYLLVFEESLFFICRVITRDISIRFDIWRMGEYNVVESWNRIHTLVSYKPMDVQPVCFKKNGEILWVEKAEKNGRLMSTNLKDSSYHYLGRPISTTDSDSDVLLSCLYYVESLTLLDYKLW